MVYKIDVKYKRRCITYLKNDSSLDANGLEWPIWYECKSSRNNMIKNKF